MITFKSNDDLQKLPSDDPAYPVVMEMVEHLINAYTMPGYPYDPENSGYVVLIERGDAERIGVIIEQVIACIKSELAHWAGLGSRWAQTF